MTQKRLPVTRPKIALIINEDGDNCDGCGRTGFTCAELLLLGGLQELYGYTNVLVFSSRENAEAVFDRHPERRPEFVVCVLDSRPEEINRFFKDITFEAKKVIALDLQQQLPGEIFDHDDICPFGEERQGDALLNDLLSIFGPPDEAHQPPAVIAAAHNGH